MQEQHREGIHQTGTSNGTSAAKPNPQGNNQRKTTQSVHTSTTTTQEHKRHAGKKNYTASNN
jgi:hypothetical protein